MWGLSSHLVAFSPSSKRHYTMSAVNAYRMRIYACLSMVTIWIFLAFLPSSLPKSGLSLVNNLSNSTSRENYVANFTPSKHHTVATSVVDSPIALAISIPTHSLPRESSEATIAGGATEAVSNATLGVGSAYCTVFSG